VVAPRIELSATAVSGPSGQPVLDYQNLISRAGRFGAACAHPERKRAGSFFNQQQAKEKGPASPDTGPFGSSKSGTKCHNRLFFSLAGA
jgi:hypothetical protein